MKIFLKILLILDQPEKRKLIIMAFLSLIGMLFEITGLGMLIPALSIMLKPNLVVEYPSIKPILEFFGSPSQNTLIVYIMLAFLIFIFIKMIFMIYLTYKQTSYVALIFDKLSQRLFNGYLHLPYSFHLDTNSAILLRNIQNEVNNYCDVIKSFLVLLLELLTAIGIFVFLFIWQPYATLIVCLLTGGAVWLYVLGTKKKVYNWGLVRQELEGYVNQHLMQGLGGIKEVKLMGKEFFFLKEFSQHSSKKNRIIAKQLALIQVPRLFLEFLSVLGIVCLVFISVYRHVNIEYLLTILGVYMIGSYRLIPSVNKIMASLQNIKFHQPVVNLISTELERFKRFEKNAKLAEVNDITHMPFNHSVSVENVSFHYSSNNRLVLRDISFQINKGECIGIIGESGSGKSTMIDLILGLMQPVKGEILCDGKTIQKNMRNWQNLIGYVPQNIYLTDSSLKANIAFGIPQDQIQEAALEDAISCAMLDSFVKNLDHGVNTQIGERGTKISGGQRQRIGIARALYHNPELLILDEATSALDSETEYDVMKAVTDLKGTRTIIIVAHRHSTLAKCDRIYEFGNGKIIRTPTPGELNIVL